MRSRGCRRTIYVLGARLVRLSVLLSNGPQVIIWSGLTLYDVERTIPGRVLLTCVVSLRVVKLLKIIERIVLTWVYVSTVTIVLGTTGTDTIIWLLTLILRLASMLVKWEILESRLLHARARTALAMGSMQRSVGRLFWLRLIRWLRVPQYAPTMLLGH